MTSKKHRHHAARPPSREAADRDASQSRSGGQRAAKPWTFRLLASILIPTLLLGTAELTLRLLGYGHPATFYLESRINGQQIVFDNPRFGERFFPPQLTRTPTPTRFPAAKPAGTFRILLFGESAALGDPRPAYGMGRYLEALLGERHPSTRFEVINVAMAAINSHVLREMTRECVRYDADCWIIYMGNNEMVGPFGAATIFGLKVPPLALIRAQLALKKLRLGQALSHLADRLSPKPTSPWRGPSMFLDQAIAPDDPKRTAVHQHFESNLRDMLEYGVEAGVPILLCSVASNLKDCPPLASRHSLKLDPAEIQAWNQAYTNGLSAEQADQPAPALDHYAAAEQIDPLFAEARYRQGQLSLALNNTPLALNHLQAARDADALPFRTDTEINRLARELATEFSHQGVIFVDMAQAFNTEGPADRRWFLDHVHFTFEGNDQAARLLADSLAHRFPDRLHPPQDRDVQDSREHLEALLALTDWNRAKTLESMIDRLSAPPFSTQSDHAERLRHLAKEITELRAHFNPQEQAEAKAVYSQAIARHPDDPRLYENYAEFQEATRDIDGAIDSWNRVSTLLPHYFVPWFHLGRLQALASRSAQAHEAFQHCLKLRPDLDEARLEIGRLLFSEGRHEASLKMFEELHQRNPDNSRVLRYMAEPLGALQRRDQVIAVLNQAVQLQPGYWEARYLLGVELGLKGDYATAITQFAPVVQARPDFLLARINLGVAYARTGQFPQAREQFEAVLQLDPNNADALQYLRHLNTRTTPQESRRPPPER